MKPDTPCGFFPARSLALLLAATSAAFAADGTWPDTSANGNWSDSSKWIGGIIPNGIDDIATIINDSGGNHDLTNDIVGLTLGGIDVDGTSGSVRIFGGNAVTLQTTSGQPVLESLASGRTLQFNVPIEGTQGFIRRAPTNFTRLQLNAGSDFTGQVIIESGNVVLGSANDSLLGETGPGNETIIRGGAGLNLGGGTRNTKEDIIIETSRITTDTSANGVGTFTGTITLDSDSGSTVGTATSGDYTMIFDGLIQGDGVAGLDIDGGANGNFRVQLNAANTWSETAGTSVGMGGGSDKEGSIGLILGDDEGLSSGDLTLESGLFRFAFSSADSATRVIDNDIVWEADTGSVPTVPGPNEDQEYFLDLARDGSGDLVFDGDLDIEGNTWSQLVRVVGEGTSATFNGPITAEADTQLVAWSTTGASLTWANTANDLGGTLEVRQGPLDANGQLGGGLTVAAAGSFGPGASIGSFSAGGDSTIAGSLEIEVDGTSVDTLDITGALDVSGGVLNVTELGAGATEAEYVIVTYTGSLSGILGEGDLPAGYSIDDSTPGQIKLVVGGGGGSNYETFASNNGLDGSPGAEDGFDDNPDGDPFPNGLEFALGTPDIFGGANSEGNPLQFESFDELVTTNASATGLTFIFNRSDESESEVFLRIEYDDDLEGDFDRSVEIGPESAPEDLNGVTVTVVENEDDPDEVTVVIPATGNSANGKLFARFVAEQDEGEPVLLP